MGYKKYIRSGHIIEVMEYQFKPCAKGGYHERGEATKEDQEENYKKTNVRRREFIRRLVLANFDNRDKFITLTFRKEITNIPTANKLFKEFIQRMRYQYGDFKYIAVIEFQDENRNGVVHYHMMANTPYIPAKKLEKIWGNGFVKVNSIEKVDNLGAYVVKYMHKDTADKRLMGKKAYLCSQGLTRWQEIAEWQRFTKKARSELEELITGKEPVYTYQCETDYLGQVIYKEFNLKRL